MLPIETESFKDDGVMVGLWRQCIRYLPDKYECYENLNQNIEDNDDPLCKCTCYHWSHHLVTIVSLFGMTMSLFFIVINYAIPILFASMTISISDLMNK